MPFVLYEIHDAVAVLTINRPKALNALNTEIMSALQTAINEIDSSSIRCLIVTGSGPKAFVAGADITEMATMDSAEARALCSTGNQVFAALERLPMPTIAAVNGYALGGGFELALSCDIRIASAKASFALPEVSLGILPGYGGLQRLARLVGPARTKELAFTAKRINAEEALSWGVVNELALPEELLDRCMKMAETIAGYSAEAVNGIKKVVDKSIGKTMLETVATEENTFAACFGTPAQKQAMAAFLNKRS